MRHCRSMSLMLFGPSIMVHIEAPQTGLPKPQDSYFIPKSSTPRGPRTVGDLFE